jgi:hypothetical protein
MNTTLGDELRRLSFRIEELRKLLRELEERRGKLLEKAQLEGVEVEKTARASEVEVEHSTEAVKILLIESRRQVKPRGGG